jgi:hypothetical protein
MTPATFAEMQDSALLMTPAILAEMQDAALLMTLATYPVVPLGQSLDI